jgi:hypothetical protein
MCSGAFQDFCQDPPGAWAIADKNDQASAVRVESRAIEKLRSRSRLVITNPGLHGVEARLLPDCRPSGQRRLSSQPQHCPPFVRPLFARFRTT